MRVEIHVISGPAKGQAFTFDKPAQLLFGRAAAAQISLPNDRYVSRQHFLVEIAPPECTLRDLDSKNGVIVNGVRYGGQKPPATGVKQAPAGVQAVRLQHGDEIVVGDTHIKVAILPDEEAQPAGRANAGGAALLKLPVEALPERTPKSVAKPTAGVFAIKGYQIDRELKHSGIGKVYKATENRTGQAVAIKTLVAAEKTDAYHLNAFQREIAILRQLKHQHIVRLWEHGQAGNTFYFVFEFVEGPDLAKLIQAKGGRLALADAVPLMLGMLEGLAYAHQAKITLPDAAGNPQTFTGIVHRNLKPQNILLARQDEQWMPKIADFGLSKTFAAAGLTSITTPGDVFGTPVYWPREQLTHYRYLTPATDVFSIAAVFYEMLTGSWAREGFQELARKYKPLGRRPAIADYMSVIAAHPPVPIRQRLPTFPEPLAQVIDQALRETAILHAEVNLQAVLSPLRYPDAGAFRNALGQALENLGLPASAAPVANAGLDATVQAISQKEAALFVLDLAESTQYLLHQGDTEFTTLIGRIFRRIKTHASAPELIFLKGLGDGYLAVFRTMPAAFGLAMEFLTTPIHAELRVRIALHWGTVKITPEGDVLGAEIAKAVEIQAISPGDRVAPAGDAARLSPTDRILATTPALQRLDEASKANFRSAGKFRLKGFEKSEQLWVLQK